MNNADNLFMIALEERQPRIGACHDLRDDLFNGILQVQHFDPAPMGHDLFDPDLAQIKDRAKHGPLLAYFLLIDLDLVAMQFNQAAQFLFLLRVTELFCNPIESMDSIIRTIPRTILAIGLRIKTTALMIGATASATRSELFKAYVFGRTSAKITTRTVMASVA